MKIEGDEIKFSSGRKAYANRGIVGIDPELVPSQGYDGGFDWPPPYIAWNDPAAKDEATDLTAEDMRELADHMIGLWSRFRDSLEK